MKEELGPTSPRNLAMVHGGLAAMFCNFLSCFVAFSLFIFRGDAAPGYPSELLSGFMVVGMDRIWNSK